MANLATIGSGDINATYAGNTGVFGPKGNEVNNFGDATRPYDIATQEATALIQQSWEQDLRILSTTDDVFETSMTDVEGSYATKGLSIPNSIGVRLTAGGQNSVHTYPVLNPLTGKPISGTGSLLGNEKGQSMRFVRAFYNEVKDGVAVQTYGVGYNYDNAFRMYEKVTTQLTKYWAETRGRMKRQALVEWYNEEVLIDNPVIADGTELHLNPNWFIVGSSVVDGKTDDNGVPLWDEDRAVFADRVGAAIEEGFDDAGGATTLAYFDKISFFAHEYLIEALEDGTYVVTVPMPVWYNLTSLTSEGGFGKFFTDVTAYPQGTDTYKGEMGRYRDLRIIPDERWVGAVVTPETAPAEGDADVSLTYKMPGNEDPRDKSAYADDNIVAQLGFLLGKGAFIERMEKDLHFKYDVQNYEQNKGIGTFMEVGFNLTIVRNDGDFYPEYAENRGSAVLAFPSVRF